jgi:hypothetical protein
MPSINQGIDMTNAALLEELRAFPARLQWRLAACPAGVVDFAPADWDGSPAENMTIRQQICHLRDIEIDGYHKRFARILEENRPFLASIDGAALVVERRYDETPIATAMDAFAVARGETIRLLKALQPADFSRTAEFEGHGDVSLLGLAHFLASHDHQHLAGVHWLQAISASSR